MHDFLVVYQIVKNPQTLGNLLVFCFFGVLGNAHLQVHLLLQRLGIKVVEERWLLVLVDVLNLLDILPQRIPSL